MKLDTSKNSLTIFWKSLGISLGREDTWTNQELQRKDKLRLRRLGIVQTDIDAIAKKIINYKDGYKQFHRLTTLYGKDPDTVSRWTNSSNRSKAFIRLANKILKLGRNKAKVKLAELLILYELFKKKEIIKYEANIDHPSLYKKITNNEITHVLRLGEEKSKFKGEGEISYNKYKVIAVSKKTGGGSKVYKFVLIKKIRNKLYIDLALDKNEEKARILNHLSKKLKIHIDPLREKPDFTKFLKFFTNGQNDKFTLSGIEFNDAETRISIFPQFGKPTNITNSQIYKDHVPTDLEDVVVKIIRLRITFLDTRNTNVSLYILNYKNEDIIGGIKLSLNARGLNLSKRETIKEAFKSEFDFQLDTSLVYDIPEKEIYKKFLYNPPKKKRRIEVISDTALKISHILQKNKLLPQPKPTEEFARICYNPICPKYFKIQWITDRVCECGNELGLKGYSVITKIIDESKVRDFIRAICDRNWYSTTALEKTLISRSLFVLEVRNQDYSTVFIPITIPLKEDQLEILRYRYPNCVFITSRDDIKVVQQKNIIAVELYDLVYNLLNNNPKQVIDNLISEVNRNRNTQINTLAINSASRLLNDLWYLDKKSLGPEYFEADICVILNYIFKNSIWLGAKQRGKALPDALSAYPIEITGRRGCFLSDIKFSKKSSPDIGKISKNLKYIKDGKKNQLIKKLGGLFGFMFISNKVAPGNFTYKMKKIIGRRYLMGSYLSIKQLLIIYNHIKEFENQMGQDHRKLTIFIDGLELIFTKPNSYKQTDKIIIWSDDKIQGILNDCKVKYRNL